MPITNAVCAMSCLRAFRVRIRGAYPFHLFAMCDILSLFVCLIPTTIGELLSAIGIAGMDRALRANVITKSGKAVETAGDIDTLLLDKTGTITIGNRKATKFYPAPGVGPREFTTFCLLSSLSDETPEGKSVIELGRQDGVRMRHLDTMGACMIQFSAETKCFGTRPSYHPRLRLRAGEACGASPRHGRGVRQDDCGQSGGSSFAGLVRNAESERAKAEYRLGRGIPEDGTNRETCIGREKKAYDISLTS